MEMNVQTIMTLLVFGGMIAVVWGAFFYAIVLPVYRQRRRERIAASLKRYIALQDKALGYQDRILTLEHQLKQHNGGVRTIKGIRFTISPTKMMEDWCSIDLRKIAHNKEAFCAAIARVDGVESLEPRYPRDTSRYGYDLKKGAAFTWDEVLPVAATAIADYLDAEDEKEGATDAKK